MAFSQLEPIGTMHEDVRAGTIAAMVLNAAGGKKTGGGAFTWQDFFGPDEDPDPEVLRAKMIAALDGPIKRKRKPT